MKETTRPVSDTHDCPIRPLTVSACLSAYTGRSDARACYWLGAGRGGDGCPAATFIDHPPSTPAPSSQYITVSGSPITARVRGAGSAVADMLDVRSAAPRRLAIGTRTTASEHSF